jgi:hypothetical protein
MVTLPETHVIESSVHQFLFHIPGVPDTHFSIGDGIQAPDSDHEFVRKSGCLELPPLGIPRGPLFGISKIQRENSNQPLVGAAPSHHSESTSV